MHKCFITIILYFIACSSLSNPANGYVIIDGSEIGDIATYYCNPGYYMNGSNIVTCLIDRKWSEPPPTCEG